MVPRIPALPYREVCRLLRAHGFVSVSQSGSHEKFRHPDGRWTIVPRHGREIHRGLVADILKEAGIDPDEVRR